MTVIRHSQKAGAIGADNKPRNAAKAHIGRFQPQNALPDEAAFLLVLLIKRVERAREGVHRNGIARLCRRGDGFIGAGGKKERQGEKQASHFHARTGAAGFACGRGWVPAMKAAGR